MSQYNNHTRQEAYDSLKHHVGRAEQQTINMQRYDDWQLYGQRRQYAYRSTVQAILAARTLWSNDNVLMGSWAGVRADWIADMLDDLRSIAKYINVEQDLIRNNKSADRHKQRQGMHEAWSRVRSTITKISSGHAKDA